MNVSALKPKVAKEHHSSSAYRSTPLVMKVDQVHQAIGILKEGHKDVDFTNPLEVRKLISDEFDCVCSVKHVIEAYELDMYKEPKDSDVSLIHRHCL